MLQPSLKRSVEAVRKGSFFLPVVRSLRLPSSSYLRYGYDDPSRQLFFLRFEGRGDGHCVRIRGFYARRIYGYSRYVTVWYRLAYPALFVSLVSLLFSSAGRHATQTQVGTKYYILPRTHTTTHQAVRNHSRGEIGAQIPKLSCKEAVTEMLINCQTWITLSQT